jgi:hypothetical protein
MTVSNNTILNVPFTPSPAQWDVYNAALKYHATWYCGGWGAGKTYTLIQWLYDMATQYCPGLDGLLVEPDFETFDDVFMKTWRKVVPGEGSHWRITTSNRGHGKQIEVSCPDGKLSISCW